MCYKNQTKPNQTSTHVGGESYLSAEMQSVYSTASADWAPCERVFIAVS